MKYKLFLLVALIFTGSVTGIPVAATDGENTTDLKSAADVCPPGSLRLNTEGATVKSIAECNLPVEQQGEDLMSVVGTIISVVISIIGILAVIVMVIGGINFIVSQGDPNKVTKARNTILFGVVGLIISILAFAIVNFVLASLDKTSEEQEGYINHTIIA